MKKNAIRWLYDVPGQKKLYILALTALQALLGASGVLYALLLRNIVDSAAAHNARGFWHFVVLALLLVTSQVGLTTLIRWLNELSKSTFENLFKDRLLKNVLQKDFASVNAVHTAEWLNRLTNDTVVVAGGYVEIMPGLAGMVVKLISAVLLMIALDWRFSCILLPCGFFMIGFTYAFRRVLKRMHKRMQECDGRLRVFLQEHIGSLMIIRSFVAESQIQSEAREKMADHQNARMRKNHFSNFCNTGFALTMYGMSLFGICYCGYGILTGTISYGTLTAISQLIAQIRMPFANITGYLPRFYAMTASAERLMEIERFEDDSDVPPLRIQEIRECYTDSLRSFGLRNAAFTYFPAVDSIQDLSKEHQPEVLHNLSLEIRRGEYVAFTGHSGCGKSTVLKLLMSIYRLDVGERFIRFSDGSERRLSAEWRRLFAYVPQGNQLMSGTIREVITFAEKTDCRNDERIYQALKIACADEFVTALDNGIDTLLGERGTGLSEGQMQRLAIARALYSESPVLLLDEATSALDAKTEEKLLQNLRSMTDKTVVIVTHRPAALKICDRTIDFKEGTLQ